jgi:hypothetical protein
MSQGIMIPSVQGVQDPQVARLLTAMKAAIETHTGHNIRKPRIQKLGATADLAGVINKINEIVARLED